MSAEAKYATARNPDLATIGRRVAVVSKALGAPFMPWQAQVADVAGEIHPSIPGAWRYPVVIVTVPRQAGKTTLLRAVSIDRAITTPAAKIFMTAQTGKDARARWKDWADAATARTCPLAGLVTVRMSAGTEALRFPNSSEVSPFAPTPSSLHGYTPPLVMVDEAWAFSADEGAQLEAAISPAQITLPNRQLWIVSTQGDAGSEWLARLIELGRACTTDPDATVAYFEWSASEDADPYAPETLDFHPAVGHTQTRESLLELAERETPGNWRRAFLNLPTITRESAIELTVWDSLAVTHDPPPVGQCAIGYSVAADRSGSSIWAAHLIGGAPCLHLVKTNPGAAWLVPALVSLHNAGARAIAANDAGHTSPVTAEVAQAGVSVDRLGASEYAAATAAILGRISDGTISHDESPELRTAFGFATLKPLAGGQGWDDKHSAGPIDHVHAATAAAWAAERLPVTVPIF